jgi:hypothetical protein
MVVSKKGYSLDWRDIVRPSVLKRDKYRCSHCSLGNRISYAIVGNSKVVLDDDWLLRKYIADKHKIYKVTLNIAHTCSNKACVNEAHLITLCNSCHLRYDKHTNLINRLRNAANKGKTS